MKKEFMLMGLGTKARLIDQIRVDHIYDADGTYDGTAGAMDIDMQGWDGCLVMVFGQVSVADGTDHLVAFKVISNSASDGTGTDTDLADAVTTDGGTTTTLTEVNYGTVAPTTLNSQFYALDIRADQMPQGDRYIGASTTKAGTFEIDIVYIRYNGDHAFKGVQQATQVQFQLDG